MAERKARASKPATGEGGARSSAHAGAKRTVSAKTTAAEAKTATASKGRSYRDSPWHRLFVAPPLARLAIAAVCGVLVGLFVPLHQALPRILAAWNVASLVYLTLAIVLMVRAEEEHIKKQASLEERSRSVVLALIVICAIAMLLAILGQLSALKEGDFFYKSVKIGLSFSTLLVSWLLVHVVYALYYAHEYHKAHARDPRGGEGLRFQGNEAPDYFDFLYFAFVIGMTAQTSDTEITTHHMRRLATVHGLLSFFINTAVIALTVNVTAQLAG